MPAPFDPKRDWEALHRQIAGLGEQSSRKSYYPELQKRLQELLQEVERRKRVENELHLQATILEEEVAQRQNAEELASMERDNARAFFEAAPVGMMIIDESCRVIDANRSMEAITGKKAPELIDFVPGQVFECMFTSPVNRECGHSPECDVCSLRRMVRNVMNSRQPRYGSEISLMRRGADGHEETLLLKVSMEPIHVSGKPCAILAAEDITGQRRIEEELQRSHKIESLGVLAGGIAHDFNNLLTGVMGNLSLALLKSDSNSVTMPLKRALQATERATDLTRQLLTFAKGGAPVKQLASVVDIVKDSAEFALRGADVACQISASDDVWPAEVDVGQLSQVINNLVINADQAMPGGGTLRIAIENCELGAPTHKLPAGRYIHITIADEGVGIPRECLARIFDPYFTTKQTGSGLGLASVHSIITRHGGQIDVASEAGVGTEFSLYLPASDIKPDSQRQMSGGIPAGSGRILVMDDEDYIRAMTSEMLEILGYESVVCANGHQACELYEQALRSGRPFSAVIMDLTIPGGMGGVEAIARLRQLDPAVRGIVASGYSNDPIVASHGDFGFIAAMPKPYTMKKLAEVLQEVIARRD